MLPARKGSKLSTRSHSQSQLSVVKPGNTSTPLDDSMDDFIVTRPLRAERKSAKLKEVQNDSFPLDSDPGVDSSDQSESSASASVVKSSEPLTVLVCPLCAKTFKSAELKERHVSKCAKSKKVDDKTLLAAEELQERQMAERLSMGLPVALSSNAETRRPRRNYTHKAVDPSDLSLAIAMSESLMSANEEARRKEEELLLTENMVEVISELRQEESSVGSLAHVFQKPEEVVQAPPARTRRKAPTAGRAAGKKETRQYVLLQRSQAERERMIADRAATILSQPTSFVNPFIQTKETFVHSQPVSEFVRQHSQADAPLWQRASLTDATSEHFYVSQLRSVLSPPKKKAGYTNILLHASQLPGRNSSQVNTTAMMSTQAILEELAMSADGGFVDESSQVETRPEESCPRVAKLVDDWSHFVNNPMLSDVTCLTADGRELRAHRLVLAARCPNMMDGLKEQNGRFTLDWRECPASAATRVLRYVYTARYEHDVEDGRWVYRLARRYRLTELLDLFHHHYDYEEGSLLEDEEEDQVMTSPTGPTVAEKSVTDDAMEANPVSTSIDMDISANLVAGSMSRTTTAPASSSNMDISVSMAPGSASWATANATVFTPKKDASASVVSRSTTKKTAAPPLSPDMFAESICVADSDEEPVPEEPPEVLAPPSAPSSPSDVIDLTQEDRSSSPAAEAVEDDADQREVQSDADVSMTDGSRVQANVSPTKIRTPTAPSPAAPAAKVDSSFNNYSFSSWNYPDDGWGMGQQSPYIAGGAPSISTSSVAQPEPPQSAEDEFPDEMESLFVPSTSRCSLEVRGIRPLAKSPRVEDEADEAMNTPEGPRLTKKRKIEVTPLPDYQSMDTPVLKKELDKYGLKPLKRKNAVKMLHHIYEELHPLVTDSESSFQDTPDRRRSPRKVTAAAAEAEVSPVKSQDSSQASQSGDEENSAFEDEESLAAEMDKKFGGSSQAPGRSTLPLSDQLKEFLKKRPDIHKKFVTYEPVPFEYLYKEVRQSGIRVKAVDLLDWLDEECITTRMKNTRNRRNSAEDEAGSSPSKSATSSKSTGKGHRVAKKLIS